MFKKNPDKMRTEPTPERVYALCKAVRRFDTTKNEIAALLEPQWLNNGSDIFAYVFNVAQELDLVREVDGLIMCKGSEDSVEDMLKDYTSFRRHTARQVLGNRQSTFFLMTAWYLSTNEKHFDITNVDDLALKVNKELKHIDDSALRGWRFWVSFLGIGVLHRLFLIPNMCRRLEDALENDRKSSQPLPREEVLPFSVFYRWLEENCPEGLHYQDDKAKLCLGLSNGLRMLHDAGRIQLHYRPDSADRYELYRMDAHRVPGDVSEILIRK